MLFPVVLFCLVLVNACLAQSDKYCLNRDPNPYLYYGTKTAYQFVYQKKITPHNVPNCQPVQVWLLSRHGTRYPGKDNISKLMNLTSFRDNVVYNHRTRKTGGLCYEDVEGLKNWRVVPRAEETEELTGQGYNDMFFMAKRLKTYFPEVLNARYTPENFIFKFAEGKRVHDSARAFADGLFGKEAKVQIPDSFQDDDFLKPGKNCSAMDEAENDPKNLEEINKFKEGPLMTGVVSSVSQRLGFLYNLTFDMTHDVYSACRFDKAWNYTATSPWCAPFHKEDLKIMEYYEDLKHYYRSGYGNDLTVKVGCPIVKDLINRFSKLGGTSEEAGRLGRPDEGTTPKGVFYFVNSKTLRSVVVRLGLAKDASPLTHDNYPAMGKRQWKTSQISPFAGNLAAVFYKCHGNYGEENKIMFYLNEHKVDYEGCNVGLCDWSYINGKFGPIVDQDTCSYKFCQRADSSGPRNTIKLFLIVTGLLLLARV